jgi:hypothetical protein
MAATEATNPGSYAGMEGAHLSCEDMEFQAEWELITVIPNFRGGKLAMISVRACTRLRRECLRNFSPTV